MLRVLEYGDVDKRLRDEIIKYISRVIEDEPSYIEIYLFNKLDDMTAFLYKEYREFGIKFSNTYFAMHDAYRGWPRIYICIELLRKMPRNVWVGGIFHEAAHAILHGSPVYYYISLPDKLLNALEKHVIDDDMAFKILYYVSVAVKDYEVTRYLIERGYSELEYPFIIYSLKLDKSELDIWRRLPDHMMRIEYILKILKVFAAALPLLEDIKYKGLIESAINKIIESLDMGYEESLYMLLDTFKKFRGDTRENIYALVDIIMEKMFYIVH